LSSPGVSEKKYPNFFGGAGIEKIYVCNQKKRTKKIKMKMESFKKSQGESKK